MERGYVYMLTNTYHTVLYTGVTSNLQKRIAEHRNKSFGGFSARYNLNIVVYFEELPNIVAAIEREKQIKGWNRKRKEKLIASKNPNWDDLYANLL
jgi:putative endonuclease